MRVGLFEYETDASSLIIFTDVMHVTRENGDGGGNDANDDTGVVVATSNV